MRFFMLETIREFAAECLDESGETGELQRRHAAVFLGLAEQAEPYLTGKAQREWLDRLEVEHDNFRAALAWAVDRQEIETALRLSAALWRFWQMRGGLSEARERLDEVLGLPGVADRPAFRAKALEAAGGVAHWQAEVERAAAFYGEALAIERERGDPTAIANALYNLAFPLLYGILKSLEDGTALLDESLDLYRRLEDPSGIAKVLWAKSAAIEYGGGDLDEARRMAKESVAIFRELDDPFGLGWALHGLGGLALKMGDLAAARPSFEEGLRIFADAADISGIVFFLDNLAGLAIAEGDRERAVRLSGAAAALGKSTGTHLADQEVELKGGSRPGEGEVDDAAVAALWAQGQAMSLDEAVKYALGDGRR